jgi:ribosomal protein S18 acetylase RimI-like enzyme
LPELVVRSCKPDEASRVIDLWREARSSPGGTDEPASLRALTEADPGALLMAEIDGHVVGSLIAAWDGWRGNMYRLVVHPAHRHRGIALRLVEAGEALLRSRGARRVTALVWREDAIAVNVWLRAGYTHEEGTGRFVRTLQ